MADLGQLVINNMRTVIILRGVSGSGKSTVAEFLATGSQDAKICTADDYFLDEEGNYKFDPLKLGAAHRACMEKFERALKNDYYLVICANTNTKEKDFQFYIDKAAEYGYAVFSLVVENRHGGQNEHGVPENTLRIQESNLRNSLKLI